MVINAETVNVHNLTTLINYNQLELTYIPSLVGEEGRHW